MLMVLYQHTQLHIHVDRGMENSHYFQYCWYITRKGKLTYFYFRMLLQKRLITHLHIHTHPKQKTHVTIHAQTSTLIITQSHTNYIVHEDPGKLTFLFKLIVQHIRVQIIHIQLNRKMLAFITKLKRRTVLHIIAIVFHFLTTYEAL